MNQLAIVIPAWKPDFFHAALASLAAQTDQRFTVYVADDGGPPELADACRAFPALDLVYHRFDENLGGTSLTGHWNRAVARSAEPWVWLFGDDDEMHPECVARFHDEREGLHASVSVVRFDTDVIDEHGAIRQRNPSHPREESGAAFVFDRLLGRRNSYVVEYVFRRAAFDRAGGFPDYPAAWCADDAAWYTFSEGGPIVTIPGPRVRWRASGVNITGANLSHQEEKLRAGRRFLDFVAAEVEPADRWSASTPGVTGTEARADPRERAEAPRGPGAWKAARSRWFEDQIRYLSPLPLRLLREVTEPGVHWQRGTLERVALAHGWSWRARLKAGFRRLTTG